MKKRHAATSRRVEMEQIRWTLSTWLFFATMFGSKVFFRVDFYQNNKCFFDFYSHNFHIKLFNY
jgi:hypothetical protein